MLNNSDTDSGKNIRQRKKTSCNCSWFTQRPEISNFFELNLAPLGLRNFYVFLLFSQLFEGIPSSHFNIPFRKSINDSMNFFIFKSSNFTNVYQVFIFNANECYTWIEFKFNKNLRSFTLIQPATKTLEKDKILIRSIC